MIANFNKFKPSTITMVQFNSCLSNKSDKDSSTNATHLCVIIYLLISKGLITLFFKLFGFTRMVDQNSTVMNMTFFSFLSHFRILYHY